MLSSCFIFSIESLYVIFEAPRNPFWFTRMLEDTYMSLRKSVSEKRKGMGRVCGWVEVGIHCWVLGNGGKHVHGNFQVLGLSQVGKEEAHLGNVALS